MNAHASFQIRPAQVEFALPLPKQTRAIDSIPELPDCTKEKKLRTGRKIPNQIARPPQLRLRLSIAKPPSIRSDSVPGSGVNMYAAPAYSIPRPSSP